MKLKLQEDVSVAQRKDNLRYINAQILTYTRPNQNRLLLYTVFEQIYHKMRNNQFSKIIYVYIPGCSCIFKYIFNEL